MKRGDLYRVHRGSKDDPKKQRVYLVVSRQAVIDTAFSTVICAPVYSRYGGLPTQIEAGVNEGLKHDSAVYCDGLVSISKSTLTDYIGSLPHDKMEVVNAALRVALALGTSAADNV
jgi:mRNA interferase MazF